ncbi:hypothetical protein JOD52_000495 [Brachybacterium muris]|uniref:Uncharacterized protein n=1 Tax=Brachybacterium muris UCD-AY4 TaxID=1249481 RepID=A0A022KYE2_9MICO|nr:hypothetical protein [Brachybacterium muris]EYT50783.1 hypothetical protein D641_0102980 [Brachybacterium muris UCD-AY4]MBM7499655.1 hypothetical protein [Brachybacterium muris]MCT2295908.1 hypothetical protein [Brachybacterium muris]
MTQDPQGVNRAEGSDSGSGGDGGGMPPSTGLPDFSGHSDADGNGTNGLPTYGGTGGPVTLGEPSQRSRNRARAVVLSVVGASVVLLAVVALVLSQTVFRSVLDEDPPTAYPTGPRTAEGQSEYVPDPEDPDIAPPPPIFTQAPTVDCHVPEYAEAPRSGSGTIRGGDLEYTIPENWDFPWGSNSMPYMDQVNAQGRNVEGNWYSVVNLGRVVFPDSEGGYPGMERAAVAIFQCYATTTGVITHFGENPEVTDYRTEAIEVDGYPAWIVQATYNFENPDMLETSSASIVTSIVVEGPNGPSALASDVAADHPDHVQELEEIIASLNVVE